MSAPKRQYWDSSVFCSYLNKEPNYEVVKDLLHEAQARKIEIVTSTFTLTEVLKLGGYKPISAKQEQQLVAFFEYDFIKYVNADREVCERARFYVWKHGFKPKDSIHVATADIASQMMQIDELFSWDGDFTKRNGTTALKFPFCHPYMAQMVLRLDEKSPDEEDIEK
jgi:predicted nucleic acid-binding protein